MQETQCCQTQYNQKNLSQPFFLRVSQYSSTAFLYTWPWNCGQNPTCKKETAAFSQASPQSFTWFTLYHLSILIVYHLVKSWPPHHQTLNLQTLPSALKTPHLSAQITCQYESCLHPHCTTNSTSNMNQKPIQEKYTTVIVTAKWQHNTILLFSLTTALWYS